ncbi:DNA translocase FtsK [Butyricicoccus pullicaecorum]|nr:DNA translocase FtsK [Butyricicoccus pullicaecorum]
MRTLGDLLRDGANLHAGGLLSGGLYILLEWAFSSIGALILVLAALCADLMVALRLTPGVIWEAIRRPADYEYESEEERAYYEDPISLPNVHVAAAERRAARAEQKRRRAAIDIPLDDGPIPSDPDDPAGDGLIEPKLPPDAVLRAQDARNDARARTEPDDADDGDPFSDILSLLENRDAVAPGEDMPAPAAPAGDDTPPWEEPAAASKKKKPETISDKEQAAMSAAMDESQKAPAPVYSYPPIDLLKPAKSAAKGNVQAELTENSQRLIDTLQSFGVDATIIGIVRGPSVTRFELTISRGVKFSRITALADDIALSLGAVSVRIAPIPDKVAIGIEVPNKAVTMVSIREVLGSDAFKNASSRVAFSVGKDITGAPVIGDIAKMPHLLIAGTTGSGKSVCINSMLISLLYKSTPEEVRLIMVDPKMVELGNYNGIPHLLIPVVTDPKKAAGALNWAVGEMERRYKLFADNQVRKLEDYNALMRRKKAEAAEIEGGAPETYAVLPQIVIVIDELADLMMVAAKEVETSICRIAQKARAAGMYLIVATQRPSSDVITGIMKANIPSRIAFAVASQIESRIILDQTGAEKLIGKGDMLYAPLGEGKPQRIQGCFISNDEIEGVIEYIKSNATAEYSQEILEHIEKQADAQSGGGSSGDGGSEEDEMLMEAIDVVMDCGQASVSMLQRRLKLGYSRAARIVDQMEQRGIVGPFEGSKPRQILISKDDWREMKLRRQDLP